MNALLLNERFAIQTIKGLEPVIEVDYQLQQVVTATEGSMNKHYSFSEATALGVQRVSNHYWLRLRQGRVIKSTEMSDREKAVHLAHCNQGEYVDSCKYGQDEECPALKVKE